MNQSNPPLVSVVIPCYNHEKFVQECIQSVIEQSYQNIELIIIDDGSKDNSVQKIQEMIPNCEQRFARFEFRHRPNKGLSATLNEALEWCKGKYFSPLASDDLIFNDKIEKQVRIFENSSKEILGIFGKAYTIDDKGNIGKTIGLDSKKIYFEDLFLKGDYLVACTQILLLENVKYIGYKEGFILEDWYMNTNLIKTKGYLLQTNDIFGYYRLHSSNTTKNIYKMVYGGLQVYNEFIDNEHIDEKFIASALDILLYNLRKSPVKVVKTIYSYFCRIVSYKFKNK